MKKVQVPRLKHQHSSTHPPFIIYLVPSGELGCGVVKLADWENLAEVHEAATLLDGRKQTATK